MRRQRRVLVRALVLLTILFVAMMSAAAQTKSSGDGGFDAIAKHLKTRYQARKKSIPFLGLAKFAVRIVKPAGIKKINVSLFEDLRNTDGLPDSELNALMRDALSEEWHPLVSVRQRGGDQIYIYATEEGKDIKLAVLAINKTDAVLARVKLDPKALRKFLDDPRLLGISLGNNREQQEPQENEIENQK